MKIICRYYFIVGFSLLAFSCKPKEKHRSELPVVSTEKEHDARIKQRVVKAKRYEDSLVKVMQWKPLQDGLYISKFGDIAFKTAYVLDPPNFIETYRTKFCCQDGEAFKDVIDIKTFRLIGGDWGWGGYFKDKNHIYHFWGNSGGGNFYIVDEADLATFEIVSDCYGRDKNYVYDMRFGIIEGVDPKDFKILYHDNRCLAKHKDDYYEGHDKLSPEELAAPDIQEAIKLLNKL